jgi:cell division septation protein DedD
MAKKKKAAKKATKASRKPTAVKKPVKKAKKATVKKATVAPAASRRAKPAKRKPAKKASPKAKPAPAPLRFPEFAPTFFLTAVSDTSQAYEIDGTPHHRTVESYRLELANILEYEEQDGKILYKVKPVKSPVG